MRVELFDFTLPRERIAARPAEPRDAARLLDLTADGFTNRRVGDLPGLLNPGDVLVMNDTRVIPARLSGLRDEVRIEITLHKEDGDGCWQAFARPAKRLKPGQAIRFAEDFTAEVIAREGGLLTLRFNCVGEAFRAQLGRHGHAPLPPYIPREHGPDAADISDYQTVYARRDGAVAAPTAGLHITDAMLAALRARHIAGAFLTLHVGAGTFLPVKSDDTDDHPMHSEFGMLDSAAAETINAARARGGRVVAVGTTSLRLLESAAREDGTLEPIARDVDLFILPGYRFKVVDLLLTNFHLPRSTLFMLVAAFAGREKMLAAYEHAIGNRYRFYSYGDACLLHRAVS